MKIEKTKSPDIDLSNLEKYLFNTIFVVVLLFIFSTIYYRQIPALRELSEAALNFSYAMMFFLFAARIISYQKKSEFAFDGQSFWSYCRGNRKFSFETKEISSIKKSHCGLFSSFVIKIQNQKIRIPAEMPNLTDFITNLSGHLSKEQVSDFLKFHQEALMVNSEMEKSSRFLKDFCLFIPLIAFFTAKNVWESFSIVIGILWAILSMVFPLVWTAIHLFLLRITAGYFAVFIKITGIWAFLGILLYMIAGIAYRKFYQWVVYYYRG